MEGVASMPIDLGIVERARRGDGDAFAVIYREYRPLVAGYIYRLVRNPDVAADLTQDVFINAYRAIGRTRPDLNLKAWLFTIASNAAISYHRRRRLLQWLPIGETGPEPTTPGHEDELAASEQLSGAMAALPRDQLACLLLQVRDGYSFEEIGGILGISAGAARTRAFRARSALVKALRSKEEGCR